MEDETFDVLADDTASDSSQETNGSDDTGSDDTGQSDSGTQTAGDQSQQKPSRANERITELIAERNRLQAQLQGQQTASQGQAQQSNQFEGVTDEGIDPQKFSASVLERARQQAQSEVMRQVQIMEVSKDPSMSSQYAQLQVSALMDRGFTPMDALEAYKDQLNHLREETSAKNQARDQAGKFQRQDSQIAPAGKSQSGNSGSFTNDEINAMDSATYEKNRSTILKQMQRGLIS